MTKPAIILGAGGHAKVLIDAMLLCGMEISGLCDPVLTKGGSGPFGIEVLGGDEVLQKTPPAEVILVNGIGSVTSTENRNAIFNRFKSKGFEFATVIHPSAIIAQDAALGEGVQIMAGAVVQAGAVIGANSIVNTKASVDHDCILGECVHVAPGATLSGGVRVGDKTHIGTGASIIQGLSIGEGCLVGAGSILNTNLSKGEKFPGPRRGR